MRSRLTPLAAALAFGSLAAVGSTSTWAAIIVQNCYNSGAGSLRQAVLDAAEGDTVDLSQMSCSSISLDQELTVPQANLTVHGPGEGKLTISGNHAVRVMNHTGLGTLSL